MPTSTFTIANGADDGNVGNPVYGIFNTSWYFLGTYSKAYTLFSGITIPQSTTITSATLQLNLCQSNINLAAFVFADNRNTPSPDAYTLYNLSNVLAGSILTGGSISTAYPGNTFTKSTGTKSNPADYIQINPDVTSFVQSLVNSYDYNNGAMMFKYDKFLNTPYFYAKDQGATKAAKLVINYVAATLQDKTIYRFK